MGSRLYFHQEWRTFTDFLLFYVRDVMGRPWWETEEAKKGFERHTILQWYDRFVEASKTARHEEDGIVSAVPDGLMAALVLLAYDLYVLCDHGKLQDEVVQRLRHPDPVLRRPLRVVRRGYVHSRRFRLRLRGRDRHDGEARGIHRETPRE